MINNKLAEIGERLSRYSAEDITNLQARLSEAYNSINTNTTDITSGVNNICQSNCCQSNCCQTDKCQSNCCQSNCCQSNCCQSNCKLRTKYYISDNCDCHNDNDE